MNVDSIINYFYQLRNDKFHLQNGYSFPNFFPDEPILNEGLIINKKKNEYVWKKKYENPIITNILSICVDIRLYCVNVDSIKILITTIGGDEIYSFIKVHENGYQIPYISKVNSWFKTSDILDTLAISELSIVGFAKNETSRFVIGNVLFYNQKNVRKSVYSPFFDELLVHNSFDIMAANSFSFSNNWPFLYVPFPFYLQMDNIRSSSEIFISISDTVNNKSILFQNLMYYLLKRYPYYEEYQIDTTSLFRRINSWKTISYFALIDSFKQTIMNIGDPHFVLNRQTMNNYSSQLNILQNPVKFAILNNHVYVAAIQNENLTSIQIGDELLSFNGVDAKSLIKYNNTTDNINRLIPIVLKDSAQLILLRRTDTVQTTLLYVKKIDQLYQIPHRKYMYDDGICYYKLNKWESTEYFYFQNLFLEKKWSKEIKCFILDLRNNGGGDEIAAAKIASSFITEPHPFCHYSYTFKNNEVIKESWILSTNPILRLSNLPVIILTNRYTACTSESFISFMKQYHSTTIISNDNKTAGAYSSPYIISIFGDVLLRMPYMKHYDSNGIIIERQGISPDVYIHFKEINDLAANQDKVLQIALKIAQSLINK